MSTFHEKIHKTLKQFRIKKMVPHLLLFGKHGTGKKTIIHNFLYDIYETHENIEKYVMIVDCAHGKGIKFVRDDIKFFAKTNISTINGRFKTIVLLHADKLTTDAQSALRRCIELFSSSTRFFMVVENRHNLLKPIISRFCEIYVPEQIDNGRIITNNNCYDLDIYVEEINNKMTILNQNTDIGHNDLLNLSTHFYENGVNCLHFIEWLKKQTPINMSDISDICLYFDKVKSDFRNESLLFLHILNYYYFRLKINIK